MSCMVSAHCYDEGVMCVCVSGKGQSEKSSCLGEIKEWFKTKEKMSSMYDLFRSGSQYQISEEDSLLALQGTQPQNRWTLRREISIKKSVLEQRAQDTLLHEHALSLVQVIRFDLSTLRMSMNAPVEEYDFVHPTTGRPVKIQCANTAKLPVEITINRKNVAPCRWFRRRSVVYQEVCTKKASVVLDGTGINRIQQ